MIPSFQLAKQLVIVSVKNHDLGFGFSLKSFADATTFIGIGPVEAGEKSNDAAAITMTFDSTNFRKAEFSWEQGGPVGLGSPRTMRVDGDIFDTGKKIILNAATTDNIGNTMFDIRVPVMGA